MKERVDETLCAPQIIMNLSISIAQVFALAAVAITVGHLFLPPMSLVIRRMRPIVSAVAICSWIIYRLGVGSESTSLLNLLVDQLNRASMVLSDFSVALWLFSAFQDVLGFMLISAAWRLVYCLSNYTLNEWKSLLVQNVFEWSQENVPVVKNMLLKYKTKTAESMKHMIGKDPNRTLTTTLPPEGMSASNILTRLQAKSTLENQAWQTGKVSGAVYPAGPEHTQLMQKVYAAFIWANPLHPGIWPTVNQCEGELICMTANMLHGDSNTCGTTSSGGTESIVLAMKAHRDYYGRKRGIAYPEVICGTTAHAAVDKACELLGIRKVCVDVDPIQFTLDPRQVEKRITSNTILIYASAPTFMQGVVDPIEDLSNVALQYDIGLHVDACLGGFVLPFAQKLGRDDIPKFDFECPGVTSMSAGE